MRVAIIPARAGSKRIPKKNIRPFFGRPMIAWSIDAALESHCFDRVIVSTDDDQIAEIARAEGAETPFCRPPELSDDVAGTMPVIAHALNWVIAQGSHVEYACCVYAAAPFIRASAIIDGWNLLQREGCEYVFTATTFPSPIQRAMRITSLGRVEMLYPEYSSTRSQCLEEAYHDAGQLYWGKAEAWLDQKPIFSTYSAPLVLPRYRVQDIDTFEDWERAERMFEAIKG
ncbi:pseudaminic acid cytidylyltransferase [Agrobacterium tumefaciens]|uniref:pseudaminic acid cytidylyltransferase n=1 Tax=Agrobacterium tumefaciens TaxID=358 RepID=UPI001571E11A|nr:pseudaminic acid cytidylyltransferase [Agrobacterium tumefaciens]NSZ86815.1 pseudaminic acid cytidylyltransferase [Agrobacterium tumefaciens]WCA71998.1 pseudaminic acid cytidylyltransferase [Agrobacterium tumefaciens]